MIEIVAAFCVAGANEGSPAEIIDGFLEGYNAHDVNALSGWVSEDARSGYWDEFMSGAVALRNYETIVFPRFPEVRREVRDRLAQGDLVAQTEMLTGFEEPELVLSVYRVKDGCIVEMSTNK